MNVYFSVCQLIRVVLNLLSFHSTEAQAILPFIKNSMLQMPSHLSISFSLRKVLIPSLSIKNRLFRKRQGETCNTEHSLKQIRGQDHLGWDSKTVTEDGYQMASKPHSALRAFHSYARNQNICLTSYILVCRTG